MSSFDQKIVECELIIAYAFKDKLKCALALEASGSGGAAVSRSFHRLSRNDRLAVYGDAVMASFICRKWLDTRRSKGEWTAIRDELLSNKSLAKRGFNLGLDRCVNLNLGAFQVSEKTMATTMEAILGAVQLDGGDEVLALVMVHLGFLDHEQLIMVMCQFPIHLNMNTAYQLTWSLSRSNHGCF